MKKLKLKPWDTNAQSFYEIFDKALCALKRGKYITLEDYEAVDMELRNRIDKEAL